MKFILFVQKVLIVVGILFLITLPIVPFFTDLGYGFKGVMFTISFTAVFILMMIRPLADIFSGWLWLRRLVILRKGLGILSASIVVGFMIATIIAPDSTYLASLFTGHFWSFETYAFFAHMGDATGVILLITSNTLSQRILKQNWKRIQRLSYAYFYAAGVYEAFALGSMFALYALLVITNLTVLAWALKAWHRADAEKVRESSVYPPAPLAVL